MGSQSILSSKNAQARKEFTYHLLRDISSLEMLLEKNAFDNKVQRIGAEQEVTVVDDKMRPSCCALDLLKRIDHKNYTTELSQFNLEMNLEPLKLEKGCFEKVEKDLHAHIDHLKKVALFKNRYVPFAGILPTVERPDFDLENITPYPRYKLLNEILKQGKDDEFDIKISGVDELTLTMDSIMAESCNTSFQMHLQISSEESVENYNWSQIIAGPILAGCVNSPLLLGRTLWAETRIALFQQTVDSRNSLLLLNDQRPRVTFGYDWIQDNITEIFKNDVAHYPLLITSPIDEDSLEKIKCGENSELKALALHNGNIYKWNRLCYGITGELPHLRIENRYIPSGPTIKDEVANFAFWVGVMKAMPEHYHKVKASTDFKSIRQNFYKAAKHGLGCQFKWCGELITAKRLILDKFIPMAYDGLAKAGIDNKEAAQYLDIIHQRVEKEKTGASWMVENFNRVKQHSTNRRAAFYITREMLSLQEENIPVHEWENVKKDNRPTEIYDYSVADLMDTNLHLIHEEDPILLVDKLLRWQDVTHLMVENDAHELTGIVSLQQTEKVNEPEKSTRAVKEVMLTDFMTTTAETEAFSAYQIMKVYKVNILPVLSDKKIVGIVQISDFDQFK